MQNVDQTLAIDELIDNFAIQHPRRAEVAKMRLFLKLTLSEIAYVLKVSVDTAENDWKFARVYRESLSARHPNVPAALHSLAVHLHDQNKVAEAELLFRESIETYCEIYPAGHADLAVGLSNPAGLMRDQNQLAEAEQLSREALDISRAWPALGHPGIA